MWQALWKHGDGVDIARDLAAQRFGRAYTRIFGDISSADSAVQTRKE